MKEQLKYSRSLDNLLGFLLQSSSLRLQHCLGAGGNGEKQRHIARVNCPKTFVPHCSLRGRPWKGREVKMNVGGSSTLRTFSWLLKTIRSWHAIPVHVLTVCDSSATQATKLLLKVVFFFSDYGNRLFVALSADAETTTNLPPSMSSK